VLAGLTVKIKATHTYVGDLSFTLSKGSGSSMIIDRPGYTGTGFGCSSDNVDVEMDDSSSTPVETTCSASPPALSGVLQPNNSINSEFAGQPLAGTWTLTAIDNAGGDTGTFDEWCLVPQTASGPTYTVGGDVSGLEGSGLALSLNGAETLPLVADGVFTFAGALPDGAAYEVTVATQPEGPAQTCVVNNESGTIAGANVTNVEVVCTTDVEDTIFEDGFDGEVIAVCEPLQLFEDTSFEATTADGGANTFWASDSTTGDSVFWSSGGVRTGTYAVWMGGYGGGAPETMHAEQAVVFTGSNRYLNFWRQNARQGGGVSDVTFLVDGVVVHTDSTLALPAELEFVSQSVDLSAYADGQSHTVRIQYDHNGSGEDANYFLDDATLDCEAAPAGQRDPQRAPLVNAQKQR
jgi:hypothetical protein